MNWNAIYRMHDIRLMRDWQLFKIRKINQTECDGAKWVENYGAGVNADDYEVTRH